MYIKLIYNLVYATQQIITNLVASNKLDLLSLTCVSQMSKNNLASFSAFGALDFF